MKPLGQRYRKDDPATAYPWNGRPGWPYIGPPRLIGGRRIGPQAFSISVQSQRGIRWTIGMQSWAVEQGFFVAREIELERPVIIGIDRFDRTFSYFEPVGAYTEIESRVFRCEPRYGILLDFIKQQDSFGFTGAWDRPVMFYKRDLQWYKLRATSGLRKHEIAKRRETLAQLAEYAREVRHVNRVRRIILANNDGT